VHVLPIDGGGFQLAVDLEVVIPELDATLAQEIADDAHKLCPYSNATRGNIDVNITVTDD
jgi:organic hydroperoxide reductase OsmC/OhrA